MSTALFTKVGGIVGYLDRPLACRTLKAVLPVYLLNSPVDSLKH